MHPSERIALTALAGVAIWSLVGVPLIYFPNGHEAVKPGEWLMIIATVALFGATLALWWATKDLVKGAEKTAELQLRPYVHYKNGKVSYGGGSCRTKVTFVNGGVTPARISKYNMNVWMHSNAGNVTSRAIDSDVEQIIGNGRSIHFKIEAKPNGPIDLLIIGIRIRYSGWKKPGWTEDTWLQAQITGDPSVPREYKLQKTNKPDTVGDHELDY